MCKKQTSVSHSSTESKVISLDAGLRMDGLPVLDLWDIVIEVARTSKGSERPKITSLGKLTAVQPKHTSHQETGAVFDSKTKTSTCEQKEGVPIPSTVELQDTSYVVISNETERLITKKKSDPVMN